MHPGSKYLSHPISGERQQVPTSKNLSTNLGIHENESSDAAHVFWNQQHRKSRTRFTDVN